MMQRAERRQCLFHPLDHGHRPAGHQVGTVDKTWFSSERQWVLSMSLPRVVRRRRPFKSESFTIVVGSLWNLCILWIVFTGIDASLLPRQAPAEGFRACLMPFYGTCGSKD
jgi:hypothetical protein